MDSIADLLAKRQPQEPPEIRVIKDYIREQFQTTAGILVRERDIVITVRSSALAGALRMHAHHISRALQPFAAPDAPPKRLIFRVGSAA